MSYLSQRNRMMLLFVVVVAVAVVVLRNSLSWPEIGKEEFF